MVTVLIPTATRAQLLKTTLQSILDQTALEKIERVFIADNGTTGEAERTIAEFPRLKITYHHCPGLNALEQKKLLFYMGAQTKFAAIVHDDDWWGPMHLAYALEALEANPTAAAYGTSNFVVNAESSYLNCNGNMFPWFASTYAPFKPYWEVSRMNVLLGSLLGTFCHYSSVVARSEALQKCDVVYEQDNHFAHDRMLMYALSRAGNFLFRPQPEVFVRFHWKQESFNHKPDAIARQMIAVTNWIVGDSGKPWPVIAQAFVQRMVSCPEPSRPTLYSLAMVDWCLPEIARHLTETAATKEFFNFYREIKNAVQKWK